MGYYKCYPANPEWDCPEDKREDEPECCYCCDSFRCVPSKQCCRKPRCCDDECSICKRQMVYVLSQLVYLYPGKIFNFNLEDGTTACGTLIGLFQGPNAGILKIRAKFGASYYTDYINICKIASFEIVTAWYNNAICYHRDGDSDNCNCNTSVEQLIKPNDKVIVFAAGKFLGYTVAIKVAPGIIALAKGCNLVFVSTCQIEKFNFWAGSPGIAKDSDGFKEADAIDAPDAPNVPIAPQTAGKAYANNDAAEVLEVTENTKIE